MIPKIMTCDRNLWYITGYRTAIDYTFTLLAPTFIALFSFSKIHFRHVNPWTLLHGIQIAALNLHNIAWIPSISYLGIDEQNLGK